MSVSCEHCGAVAGYGREIGHRSDCPSLREEPAKAREIRRVPYPGTEGAPTDAPHDMSHMVQIETLIADLQSIRDRFGNTCVYIRRRGLSWGAVALNHRADDEKFGLFDLQAQHDRDMAQRAEQVQRLIADRDSEREARWKCEAALTEKDRAMSVLFERMRAAGVDFSDLIP